MVSDSAKFTTRLSYRRVGESLKNFEESPPWSRVESLINQIESGDVECLTLYGPVDEKLYVLGKPGFYHLTLFIDETDGYAFDDGSGSRERIEIAGDYWPSFRVCKDKRQLIDAAHWFFESGAATNGVKWLRFSED